jgi:hypothetical protein
MKYLQEVEAAPVIYLYEAVLWVAFGRFPEHGNAEFYDVEHLLRDIDRIEDAWKGGPLSPDYKFQGFYQHELDLAGLELGEPEDEGEPRWGDDRYYDALRRGYNRAEYLQAELESERRLGERDTAWEERLEHAIADIKFVDEIHQMFQPRVDAGWAQVFRALTTGTLRAFGWRSFCQDEIRTKFDRWGPAFIGPLEPMARWCEIRGGWSLAGLAPDGNYITATGEWIEGVTVISEEVFALFPRPDLAIDGQLTADVYHEGLLIQDDSEDGAPAPKRPTPARKHATSELHETVSIGPGRGRRPRGNFAIRDLVVNYFADRVPVAGEEIPKTLVSEVQAFVEKACRETVQRSTILDHLNYARFKKAS